jgi:hypothetical protein
MFVLQSVEQVLAQIFARRGLLLVLCAAIAGAVSWWLGQDINWDLKNYHLYNPYALLEGRLTTDFVPASLQGFFNPLADVPYYILATKLLLRLPRVLAVLQGFYFGALVYFVCRLNWHGLAERTVLPATTATIASLIGVSAAGVVSEIGTTFNDIQGALFVLWGVYLLMPRAKDDAIGMRRALWAGVVFGVAIGVKLTSGYYIFAAICAVFISSSLATSVRNVALMCAGAAVCALLLCGPWFLWVYHQTGSPVFPLFNDIFRSDWYPPSDYTGGYFKPRSFAAALLNPLAWAQLNAHLITEVEFRDARFAAASIAAVGILALLTASGASKLFHRENRHTFTLGRPTRFLFAFAVVAYLIWITQLGALRFGIVTEVLTGTVIVLGIEIVTTTFFASRARAMAVASLAAVSGMILQLTTAYPSWGRAPYEQRTYTVLAPPLPPNSLVVLAGAELYRSVPAPQGIDRRRHFAPYGRSTRLPPVRRDEETRPRSRWPGIRRYR